MLSVFLKIREAGQKSILREMQNIQKVTIRLFCLTLTPPLLSCLDAGPPQKPVHNKKINRIFLPNRTITIYMPNYK